MMYILRKSFFVKPKLLLKYVFYALLTVIFTSVCILIAMRRTIYTTEALENLVNESEIRAVQLAIMSPFWWIVAILLIVIGIQSLIRFHKIIGPIYALEKIIAMIKQGHLGGHIILRRGDELKDRAQGCKNPGDTGHTAIGVHHLVQRQVGASIPIQLFFG